MKAFRNYLIITTLLLSFLVIFIPGWYDLPYPMDVGPKFDKQARMLYRDMLNEEQSDIFLLGDSMLETAVDQTITAKQLEKKVSMVSIPGTASAIWYLILKNNILVAEHQPEYLILFFRDSMITAPGYRVVGRYLDMVDELASPADTFLIDRAYINQMTPLERFLEAYMPIYGARWNIRENIDNHIRYTLGRRILKCDKPCMDDAMEIVFLDDNLDLTFLSDAINAADNDIYTDDALNFDNQVDSSFLPEIIRLCQENDIKLIMVRMPIIRFENDGTSPLTLSDYIQDLGDYAEANNVPFLDLDQQDIPAEYYRDVLHLNEQGKEIFTQELIQMLNPIIK